MTSNESAEAKTSPPTAASSAIPTGCPVVSRRGDGDVESSPASRPGFFWSRWFSGSNNSKAAPSTPIAAASGCPVKGNKITPASIEEAANHSQTPHPGQRIPLSTQRVFSSIPRGEFDDASPSDEPALPTHQPADHPRWQYPSEQQFYNSMLRKGHRPPVESIPSVLRIHNAVNERSWSQVIKWERDLHGNEDPKLVKFEGRPRDLSPRAWWNSRVLLTREPFDRHDWYVEDADGGEPRRYVIDFYEGKEGTGDLASAAASGGGSGVAGKEAGAARNVPGMKPPSMYIDVRPALDNPSAAIDRMTMFAREAFPGIARAWDSYKETASAPSPRVASAAEIDGRNSKRSEK